MRPSLEFGHMKGDQGNYSPRRSAARNALNFFRVICFSWSFLFMGRLSRVRMRFAFLSQIPSALSNSGFLRTASISKADPQPDPQPTRYRKWMARSMGAFDCITRFSSSAFLLRYSRSARLTTATSFSPSSEHSVLMAEAAAWLYSGDAALFAPRPPLVCPTSF